MCKEDLPISSFNRVSRNPDKLHNYCRDCHNSYRRRRYAEDPLPTLLQGAKSRAKQKGVPFDLTRDDIFIPTHCPVLGIPMASGRGNGPIANSPTIDRIVPELGYVRGNVAVISHRANTIKQNASVTELLAVAAWLRQQQKD